MLDSLPASLETRGWWVCDDFIPAALVEALSRDLDLLDRRQQLVPAGIGRGEEFQLNRTIRRDHTHWLNGATLAQCQLLERVEQLRLFINRTLFLGLFDFESHYAVYPPGGFYQKHIDSFRGQSNRVLSVVLYLNQDWLPGDGGELVIYHKEDPMPIDFIRPEGGRAVIFLSEEIPHEVLPTRVSRRSIAGWFRINNSLQDTVDPAR